MAHTKHKSSGQRVSRLEPQSANWLDSLPHPQTGEYGITITRCHQYGLVNLRCAPEDVKPIGELFGPVLPVQANHFSRAGQRIASWLGPDETLLILNDKDEPEFSRTAPSRMGARFYALTTVTDGFAIFKIDGIQTRTMLAKAISIDLHPAQFSSGMSCQTLLSGVSVTCLCLAENSIMMICRTSFSDYLESWLKDASLEYGYQFTD